MKKHAKLIISVVLCLLPMLLIAAEYHRLPEQVAIHFNAAGEPDNYAPKAFLFALPVLMAALQVLCSFAGKFDKRAETAAASLYWLTQWFIPALTMLLMVIVVYHALGVNIPILMILHLLVGFIFVIIGNYLPKCRQNRTIGVKLPWTLNDAGNWNFTHRVTGYTYFFGGFVFIAGAFIQAEWLTITLLFSLIIVPFAASLYYHLRHKGA